MSTNKVEYSINSYDRDGDRYEDGIYLHFGNTRVLVAKTLEEYKEFAMTILSIGVQIEEDLGQ